MHTCSKLEVCYYCSKDCQQKAWKTHKELCNAITFLGQQQASCKTDASNVLMLPKDKSKMARLIGEKCIINCFVNKVVNSSLLDTWALVPLVSRHWLDKYYPAVETDVSSLLDEADRLHIR